MRIESSSASATLSAVDASLTDYSKTVLVFAPLLIVIAIAGVVKHGVKHRLFRSIFGKRNDGGDEESEATSGLHRLPPPPSPPAAPVVGHLHLLSKYQSNPWEGFDSFRAAHGDIVSLQLGVWRACLISSSALIREVLHTKSDVFMNRPAFNRYNIIFGGDRDNCKHSLFACYV